mgnify:CR=1 FL=1
MGKNRTSLTGREYLRIARWHDCLPFHLRPLEGRPPLLKVNTICINHCLYIDDFSNTFSFFENCSALPSSKSTSDDSLFLRLILLNILQNFAMNLGEIWIVDGHENAQ